VVIDAGHGGRDSGARARGLTEKSLALDIAKRLADLLRPDFRVILTRSYDHFIELDQRAQTASRQSEAVLVSIHLNHGRRWRAGPETYWWRVDSYSLARRMQRHLSGVCPHESGNAGLVRRRLRLTRNPTIPCVLVECGYLTNLKDARLLAATAYRQQIARALASALREQTLAGDAGMGPLPAPIYAPPSKATDARG
jgi:N-acetylmuramoyl-L-alanine amidase